MSGDRTGKEGHLNASARFRRAAVLIVAILLGLVPTATQAAQPTDPSAAQAVGDFLARHFARFRESAPEATYRAAWHDLSGDGRPEVLVYLHDPIWCGPHGCDLFIFTPHASGWRQVDEISVAAPPIRLLARRSRGWHDLSVYVRSSLMPGERRALAWDGRRYVPTPRRVRERDEVRALITLEGEGSPLFRAPPAQAR